jgi:hypothetical protein
MQLLNGYINQVKEVTTKYGQKIVMECVIGGRESAVWRPAKDGFLLSIPSGTQAQFTYDSKGKYHLVDGS